MAALPFCLSVYLSKRFRPSSLASHSHHSSKSGIAFAHSRADVPSVVA